MSYNVVKGDNNWDYHVVDTLSENEPVAGFLNLDMANSYCSDLNRTRSLSCCKRSLSSSGWHHDHDCKGHYEKPVKFEKYRVYEKNGTPTVFQQISHNEWECTHGGWTFEERLDKPPSEIYLRNNDKPLVVADSVTEYESRQEAIDAGWGDYL